MWTGKSAPVGNAAAWGEPVAPAVSKWGDDATFTRLAACLTVIDILLLF